ncbi:MAG TPA: type II secretion system F family protein [Candidatus Saccharimonadales bacterium]|nr:type II secretion system F family protein [Candidatus Saccharimonadales bacterium]
MSDFDSDLVRALLGCLAVVMIYGFLRVAHFVLTLPMRRAERARLFLDLLDTALQQGLPVEETFISLAQSRDLSMGVRFHLVTAYLEQNARLMDALAKVPRFLPPQVTAMLGAGQKIGDLRKVLPACRQLLKDGVSHTRSAINYLFLITFLVTPAAIWVSGVLAVAVIPKFLEIGATYHIAEAGELGFIFRHTAAFILLQIAFLLLLWTAVFIYMGGPRLLAWFPVLGEISYRMPWRRKRMQRDFSTLLAILLDSGVAEAGAIRLAADCTANVVFQRRGAQAAERLKQGMALPEAVRGMDDSGEFGWRLSNATHGSGGFLRALAGWHESLAAQAFQQEQAAAHIVTTAVVLCSGVFVAGIVISVFMFLITIINIGVLW